MSRWKLLRNLRAGLRLATWYRVRASDFHCSVDQLVALVLLQTGLAVVCGYAIAEEPRTFEWFAVYDHALFLVAVQSFAYIVARESGRPWRVQTVTTMLLSASPAWWVFYTFFIVAVRDVGGVSVDLASSISGLLVLVWIFVAAYRAARLGSCLARRGALPITLVYAIGALMFYSEVPPDHFFQTDHWAQWNEEEDAGPSINEEELYYAQFGLVAELERKLLPQRPGVVDLYFVSFGPYGDQDVFMREALFAQELFDRRFDTRGRSAALINNVETMDRIPLASASNLSLVLNRVGQIMDPEEDVLFLFMTSHGSEEYELSVSFDPLSLNSVDPESLAALLDEAGIKWRVLLVSACYSGGFIESLQDPYSLVITSAASDQRSFGCSNEADLTYFGRAYFGEQLQTELSFVTAFEKARIRVREWESDEEREESLPQLASDAPILEKLSRIEDRLRAVEPAPIEPTVAARR